MFSGEESPGCGHGRRSSGARCGVCRDSSAFFFMSANGILCWNCRGAKSGKFWNCRGAKSGEFLRELKDFQRIHKQVIIILIEPKISVVEADSICKRIGKSHWFCSKVVGFSGGVWMLWNAVEISVTCRYAHKSFL